MNKASLEANEELEKLVEKKTAELERLNKQLQQEIAEHKYTALQCMKSEEKFRTIADYTYNWEYWLSAKGEYIYNSPSCEGLTGYTAEEFMADSDLLLKSIVHPDDIARVKEHCSCSCYTSREANHIVFRIITKKGELRWVAHSCQPVHDSHGQFVGRRASNRNITALKLLEEHVNQSEKRFRLALDASSDGVWDWNLITNETFYGEKWYRVLGYTDGDAKNKSLSWEELLHPDDKAKTISTQQNHIGGVTSHFEAEFRMRNKAGKWQWFLSRGKVVERDESGKPLRFIGTHTDITKNKKIETELQNIQNSLEKKVNERIAEIQEVNIALKVLLKKIEQDKIDVEQQILTNVAVLVTPYLETLQKQRLDGNQASIVNILAANIQEITSSFSHSVSLDHGKLTPKEMQIANLVKHGTSTKEIAEMMNLAPGTISIHRKNIRKKLGISRQKVNLQSYLSSYW